MNNNQVGITLRNLVTLIVPVFVASWLALALLAFFFVQSKIQNNQLKSSIVMLEKNLASLNDEKAKQLRRSNEAKDNFENKVVSYLEWQFVLKEQVSQAGQRLASAAGALKDLEKDKSLANLLYYNLGLSYTLALDFESAIKAFEEAARLEPGDAQSLYNLGLLYSTYRRDHQKAIECYTKYLELVPSGPKSQEVRERIEVLKK